MTTEQMTNLIHEAWEKFIHAPYPDVAFYDLFEQAIITAINETKEEDSKIANHFSGMVMYGHVDENKAIAEAILASKIKE